MAGSGYANVEGAVLVVWVAALLTGPSSGQVYNAIVVLAALHGVEGRQLDARRLGDVFARGLDVP